MQFDNSEIGKVKRLAKKYGILYSIMPNINKNQTEIIFHSEAVPRINVMLQKMKSGQITTFDDYVKKSDTDGKNKLLDFFQKQKEGKKNSKVKKLKGRRDNAGTYRKGRALCCGK